MANEILKIDLSNYHKYAFEHRTKEDIIILSLSNTAKKIRIHFFDAVFFKYELLAPVVKLIEVEKDTVIFAEVMSKQYDIHPDIYPYKHYQILDSNGFSGIEIISLPLDVYVDEQAFSNEKNK